MNALAATLRRVCTPKASSGKLEVSPEIYKQWKQGGAARKELLNILIKSGGDKVLLRVNIETIHVQNVLKNIHARYAHDIPW